MRLTARKTTIPLMTDYAMTRKPISLLTAAILSLTVTLAAGAQQRRQSTTRKLPATATRHSTRQEPPAVSRDTIAADTSAVAFYGYEKTLRSSRETFFISNRTSRKIAAVTFTIEYLDSDGRQLHKRTETTPIEIPPGETRRADIRSWDSQCTFYYHTSPPPRTSAIPYSVAITPETIITENAADR